MLHAAVSLAILLAPPATGDATVPSTDGDVLRPATAPLDPRVSPEKITTPGPPPPLPEQVVLPMPPVDRIATKAEQVPIDAAHWARATDALRRGLDRLREMQADSGAWMGGAAATPTPEKGAAPLTPPKPSPVAPAVTALAIKGFVQAGTDAADDPALGRAVRYLLSKADPDGSFGSGSLETYITSTVVSALAGVDESAFHDRIEAGAQWLERTQWDQAEGIDPTQDWFGGSGYGHHGRPDLSNTQLMLEALYDAGRSPSEPAFQRSLAFLSRAQNLKSVNPSPWAGSDGGFVYTPANGGESLASEVAGEGRHGELIPEGTPRSLRSYGSMTYAGFKSLLYAGLSADDVRVRAAFDWIRHHWTFDENPGVGQRGLYYYYHAMARALRIAQQDTIADTDGALHNWREELIDAIASRQRSSGGWRNDVGRWLEDEEALVTTYCVLALEEALKPVPVK